MVSILDIGVTEESVLSINDGDGAVLGGQGQESGLETLLMINLVSSEVRSLQEGHDEAVGEKFLLQLNVARYFFQLSTDQHSLIENLDTLNLALHTLAVRATTRNVSER